MEYLLAQDRRTDVFGTDFKYAHEKQVNNYGTLACTSFFKYCIFRYELAFVVGITSNRWHQCQSDAVRRINDCALATVLESFYLEEGSGVISVFVGEIFSSH